MPLIRSTLARTGHTPVLRHRASHRDKDSVAAALTLSPRRGHVSLYYQTYPNHHVDSDLYAHFIHELLRHLRGELILIHDQGNMHRGPALRELQETFARRLQIDPLPAYAPELNPVEQLWNHLKDEELANYAPRDVPELDRTVRSCLEEARHDQHRLRSFFAATPLPWDGLTVFF